MRAAQTQAKRVFTEQSPDGAKHNVRVLGLDEEGRPLTKKPAGKPGTLNATPAAKGAHS